MATAKKKTAKPKKILKSGKNKETSIDVPEDCAALVLTPDGKVQVYVTAAQENEENSTYQQHEELCIAIAALIQNEAFVTTIINTFRDLFDVAVSKQQKPENSID